MNIPYFIYQIISFPSKQITRTLPRRFWDRVKISENGEPLIEYDGVQIRKSIAAKLDQVKNILPPGLHLKLLDGYRSIERQQQAWDRKWNIVKSEHPDWADDQIDQAVRLVMARPAGITNHICGGAVDVCLVNDQGEMLDFGTPYASAHGSDLAKCPMFAPGLSNKQISNRKILRAAMESAGFVWYPGEWWHYCWGDRMWAVYKSKKWCCYGRI